MDQQQFSIFQQGAETWNMWKAQHPNEVVDFKGENFTFLQLQGINFSYVDLSFADLSYTNLSHANLRLAIFRNAT